RHRPGLEIGAWRDEHIIPRYNRGGVTKFAFLLPEGSPGAAGSPAPAPPGEFPTGYFDTPAKIEAWFSRQGPLPSSRSRRGRRLVRRPAANRPPADAHASPTTSP